MTPKTAQSSSEGYLRAFLQQFWASVLCAWQEEDVFLFISVAGVS